MLSSLSFESTLHPNPGYVTGTACGVISTQLSIAAYTVV